MLVFLFTLSITVLFETSMAFRAQRKLYALRLRRKSSVNLKPVEVVQVEAVKVTPTKSSELERESELEANSSTRPSMKRRSSTLLLTSYEGEELIKPWDLRGVWSEFSQIQDIGMFSPVMRSMLNYSQLVGLLTFVNSQAMRDSIAGRAMNAVSSINFLSFDLAIDVFSSVNCTINTPLARTIMSMLLPISACVTIGLMVLIGRLICSGIGLSECVRACCFTGMLLYTATISDILSNITPVSVDGQRYVFRDTSVYMDSSSHSAVVAVSLVYSLLYGLGIPSAMLYLYSKGLHSNNAAQLQICQLRYGFLAKGYKKRFYWWELVVLCRRLLCILIVVSTNDALTIVLTGVGCGSRTALYSRFRLPCGVL